MRNQYEFSQLNICFHINTFLLATKHYVNPHKQIHMKDTVLGRVRCSVVLPGVRVYWAKRSKVQLLQMDPLADNICECHGAQLFSSVNVRVF